MGCDPENCLKQSHTKLTLHPENPPNLTVGWDTPRLTVLILGTDSGNDIKKSKSGLVITVPWVPILANRGPRPTKLARVGSKGGI